jgi:aspartyl-tRNA synthetase
MLIFRLQSELVKYLREYLYENNFTELHTPKFIGTASESGSEVFEVKYFDRKAYLAQSPQFYKQMAMASGFERIFESGPVFRAEKFASRKHATEFTGFDLEFSYIDSYEDVMVMEEEMLTYALKAVKEELGEEIKRVFDIDVVVPTLPFPRIKLHDLYDELEKMYGYSVPESEKGDLTTEGERMVAKYSMEKYGHEFLFVTDYAVECRAFYHMRKDGVPQGYDLIWKGCEITTGAQREHRYDVLKEQAKEKGLDEDVKFYLDFFKFGCPPHGGFGIGVDRITMLMFNVGIKDAMYVFRGPDRLNP